LSLPSSTSPLLIFNIRLSSSSLMLLPH
jgi:hypothetical protein